MVKVIESCPNLSKVHMLRFGDGSFASKFELSRGTSNAASRCCSQDQHAQAQHWLRHAQAQLMHAQAWAQAQHWIMHARLGLRLRLSFGGSGVLDECLSESGLREFVYELT